MRLSARRFSIAKFVIFDASHWCHLVGFCQIRPNAGSPPEADSSRDQPVVDRPWSGFAAASTCRRCSAERLRAASPPQAKSRALPCSSAGLRWEPTLTPGCWGPRPLKGKGGTGEPEPGLCREDDQILLQSNSRFSKGNNGGGKTIAFALLKSTPNKGSSK